MSVNMKRSLTLKDAISVVAGSMIGCGIFIVSADMARQVNSAWLLMFAWLIAGVISVCGALSFGELASTISDEGGQYIYLKKIFNDKIAFLYGWTLFLVIQTGTLAAIAIAFAKFTGIIVPQISSQSYLFSLGNYHFSTQQLFAMATIVLITYINSRGVKEGVITQNIFTATKILSLIGIIFCGLFFGLNWDVIVNNFSAVNNHISFNLSTIEIFGAALVGALFSAITWNNVTFIAAEVKDPKKNVPLSMIIGVTGVCVLYLLVNMIYLGVMPLELIQNAPEDIVAAALISKIFGSAGMVIIAVLVAISAFGCINGMVMAGSRVYYKMAKDRLFFRGLAAINRKTRVPNNSLWVQCAWVCVLILWGNYSQLLDYVIYASLIFYVITTFGIFKMRKMFKSEGFKVPNFYPWAFMILSTFVVVSLSFEKPLYTLPGLLLTFAGIPVYNMWNKAKQKKQVKMNKAVISSGKN